MNRTQEILIEAGALITGHFALTSGRHAAQYMQCAKVLQKPTYVEEIVGMLVDDNTLDEEGIDFVVAPAVGAIVFGYELAREIGAVSLFTERVDGKMALRRGFEIPKGARVLVAEDVVTTGGSVKEVIDVVKASEATVVAVALIVDRSGGTVDFGVTTHAAFITAIESYDPENCPLCKKTIPLTKPGSRAISK